LKKKKESEGPQIILSKESQGIEDSDNKNSDLPEEDTAKNSGKYNFPIVGIGASAGGLAAFEAFFSAMPADIDTGMAFVLVQHLAPDHKSILTELVKRYTRMKVFEVTDGMKVEPNCTYIIPPNRDMAFLGGTLQLLEPTSPRGQRLPIDFFFRSLAHDQQERAICIVLSGTGSDGTLGMREIKGEGGMVIAQNPESTEYDGMPRSAISTGLVDYILPPAEMPAQLIAYVNHAFGKIFKKPSFVEPSEDNSLKKIFILLRAQVGHDFSQYKRSTVDRRIERRMAVNQIKGLANYVKYLQQSPPEIEALFRDLLIGVTNFFRDPKTFEAFYEKVIPQLFNLNSNNPTIRIWVVGCSTGEEAYSIAILIKEYMESTKQSFKVQIFATDIDSHAVEIARAGAYSSSIAIDVSPERLARFFTLEAGGGTYRIHKDIRDMMIFSEQNMIKDPPFSKLDLISCRNLLIYMDGGLQKKIIPLFHYALNHNGFLFLGSSETVGDFVNLFSPLDRSSKIYIRKDSQFLNYPVIGSFIPPLTDDNYKPKLDKIAVENKLPLRELTERALLEQFGPIGALVNQNGEILYLHGRTGMFLEPPPGEFEKSILKMARKGLQRDLTIALHKAVITREMVLVNGLKVKTNGGYSSVNLAIKPVTTGVGSMLQENLFLIIFQKIEDIEQDGLAKNKSLDKGKSISSSDTDALIQSLSDKLRAAEEYLQSSNEEMETANEELKSSNEEMQSVNEELQSTNEELETSKEELQSVNEELSTVNSELQNKVSDLSRVNNDMNNLLAGTGLGTIFVDHQLLIKRFTPAITQVINLIQTDVGRPIAHISSNLIEYNNLPADVQSVLDTLQPKDTEVQTVSGIWYSLRILPYRTTDNVIEGAVITFINIDEIKKTQELADTMQKNYIGIFANAFNAIAIQEIVIDDNGNPVDYIFIDANPAFEKHTGLRVKDILGRRVSDVYPSIKATDLILTYSNVALTGKSASFKVVSSNLKQTFDVCAFQVGKGKFAVIFNSKNDSLDLNLMDLSLIKD